ncbi:hypothetical protein [Mesonia aestuariivivens]|uniref:Lipoprotein n=1 Tax=Mesonia aestuariivivens TaxID=2796128 RepID=A0ABS6W0M8_9FLAO|nr:hypothetical protein [Mesonia aestuariivivens]MBW2961309.1 hypothetical protein [Mesonia aestuariivivens]
MKKLLLIATISTLLISCGRSHEEELLYNYQKDKIKENINMNIDDLNFEISEINKVEEITAKDSLKFYRDKLVNLWLGEDAEKNKKDTLTYDYVLGQLDTLRSRYQGIVLANIKADRAYENYEWEKKRDQMIDAIYDVKIWKNKSDSYQKSPEKVVSTKYKASYSINNPMLNDSKQTFDKFYYTNTEDNKFIKEESTK